MRGQLLYSVSDIETNGIRMSDSHSEPQRMPGFSPLELIHTAIADLAIAFRTLSASPQLPATSRQPFSIAIDTAAAALRAQTDKSINAGVTLQQRPHPVHRSPCVPAMPCRPARTSSSTLSPAHPAQQQRCANSRCRRSTGQPRSACTSPLIAAQADSRATSGGAGCHQCASSSSRRASSEGGDAQRPLHAVAHRHKARHVLRPRVL
jgi:hypothetical protein